MYEHFFNQYVFNFKKMDGKTDLAAKYCEEKDIEKLSSIVPKVVDMNAIVFTFYLN